MLQLGGTAVISTKRELAMWLAQVFHESIGLSTKVEIGGSSASYAPYYGQCISSKPLQMLSYAGLADVQV